MVPNLPLGQSLLLRTHFDNNDPAWNGTVAAATAERIDSSGSAVSAVLTIVDDPAFAGVTVEELVSSAGPDDSPYVFVADDTTLRGQEHLVLVVNLQPNAEEGERSFRVTLDALADVENNLSLANVDFAEFVAACDSSGVYRGAIAPVEETRSVSPGDILAVLAHAGLSEPLHARVREALMGQRTQTLSARLIPDLTESAQYLRKNYDDYRYCLEVLGLDESIAALGRGGQGYGVSVPAMDAYWSVYLGPGLDEVITVFMQSVATKRISRQRQPSSRADDR